MVFTHNGTGYDHHFYMLGLARLKASGVNLKDFLNVPEEWLERKEKNEDGEEETYEVDLDIDMSQMKLEVLAESSEKIRCIKFGIGNLQIEFLDSCKFLKDSLDNLVESLKKAAPEDLSSSFHDIVPI